MRLENWKKEVWSDQSEPFRRESPIVSGRGMRHRQDGGSSMEHERKRDPMTHLGGQQKLAVL